MADAISRLRLRITNQRHPYTGLPLWWYERAARKYGDSHPEIFNPIEQERLRAALGDAVSRVAGDDRDSSRALDLGCGTGNVTAHLLDLGMEVVAADVSQFFLDVVRERFGGTAAVQTLEVNGSDLSNVSEDTFDLVATYSVLHHIHDYLTIVDEIVRVTRPGGVIYLDHESNDNVWAADRALADFQEAVRREARRGRGRRRPDSTRWQRLLSPSAHALRARLLLRRVIPAGSRLYTPLQFEEEMDIHVWQASHIEWDRIERRLIDLGCEILRRQDYLLYRDGYPVDVYDAHRDRCSDMRLLVARKLDAGSGSPLSGALSGVDTST
jgi:SAM-dependent methyltransferase